MNWKRLTTFVTATGSRFNGCMSTSTNSEIFLRRIKLIIRKSNQAQADLSERSLLVFSDRLLLQVRSTSGKMRFKVRQSAVEPPCRCGSGGGIYIRKTIRWYMENREWWERIICGEYLHE